MGYYIAQYKNETWELGQEYNSIKEVLEQYTQCAYLYGTANIQLLMTRSVNIKMSEAELSHPLPHEVI